jgi:hypothetical protein
MPGSRPGERRGACQALVEQRPDRVPVCLWPHDLPCGLLRGHVGRRPGDLTRPSVSCRHHQPEIEQHDPPLLRHEHVRGLDVAVHLALGMEGSDALGELGDRRPQQGFRATRAGGARHGGSGARGEGQAADPGSQVNRVGQELSATLVREIATDRAAANPTAPPAGSNLTILERAAPLAAVLPPGAACRRRDQ